MPLLNVDYNTFKRVTRNPSMLGPRHGEVRRAHQMLNAALPTPVGHSSQTYKQTNGQEKNFYHIDYASN